jgi:hypothetical protein
MIEFMSLLFLTQSDSETPYITAREGQEIYMVYGMSGQFRGAEKEVDDCTSVGYA